MFELQWTSKAVKQLEKIKDIHVRREIRDAVETLKYFPKCQNIKSLVNRDCAYRLRKGRWRIFFEIDSGAKNIYITEVKKRNEHTY